MSCTNPPRVVASLSVAAIFMATLAPFPPSAFSQTSAHYSMKPISNSAGAATMTSTNYSNRASAGQQSPVGSASHCNVGPRTSNRILVGPRLGGSAAGGFDLAEPFQIEGQDPPQPGSVVIIDDTSPGKLAVADRAYNTRVAGVVSGAGGPDAGITIGQQPDGVKVAMAGRVYVLADSSHEAIRPGDLLMTSSIPGHAMRASNRRRAGGAVIGKAMSFLHGRRGLVLALVNLQ